MLKNDHESISPPTSNCSLWRYMDLTKFLSMLESAKLFFPRADSFEDPYEGVWSKAGIDLIKNPDLNSGLPPNAVDQIISSSEILRTKMFISCWVASEYESAAMWKLYLQSNEGVAIRTDHESLCKALENSTLCARTTLVKYLDYEHQPIPFHNLFFPFACKRLSFAHENELRAIIWSAEDVNSKLVAPDATSIEIGINPSDLIKAVHVSPTAPKWFGVLVEQLIERYGLGIDVVRSNLHERPTY